MPLNIDLDALIRPLSTEQPCGPNLEYAPDFLLLEEAARRQVSQEFTSDGGKRVSIEGQEPNWLEVRRLAESLLEQTRDIRVVIYYTRALLRSEGFGGLQIGLRLILGYLKQYWIQVYPELDSADGNDPTMRINALLPLVANEAVVADLRASWLLRSRQTGGLTVREIEVALGRLAAREGEQALAMSQISGILSEALTSQPELAETIRSTEELLQQLSDLLHEQIGTSAGIDFAPLLAPLSALIQVLPDSRPTQTGGDGSPTEPGATAAEAPGAPSAGGEIRSRADVIATIDRLVAHLERTEPTNPAQWLLRRAQRVMDMNFLEAIVELAPDALEQTERMVGGQLHREQQG